MALHRHIPSPPLREHVAWIWFYVDYFPGHNRQHVLPDGTFELIINLQSQPRKLFEHGHTDRYTTYKKGWLSGAHDDYLVIDALEGSSMMGVHFKPGGAAPFLGPSAGEVSGKVVELDAIFGDEAWEWRDRLMAAPAPAQKCLLMERWLLELAARATRYRCNRNGVDWAIARIIGEPHIQNIARLAEELGISHKHFIERFRCAVGMTPKLFCRIRRFQSVLASIQNARTVEWADLACDCGYFDQAHFVNDFVAFAGLNPTAYLSQRLEGDLNFIRALE